MPYLNVDVRSLYEVCLSQYQGHPMQAAMAWVEAENVQAVWKIVQTWFELTQSGEVQHRFPDPFWNQDQHPDRRPVDTETADQLIAELDADFELERGRLPGGLGPEFARLPPHARLAFAQEVWRASKSPKEIEGEATRRALMGEKFPSA